MLVLISGFFVFVCVLVGVAYYSSQQITIPCRPQTEGDPRDLGLEFEDVRFYTQDGLALDGWYIPAKPSGGKPRVVIICHGQMATRWDCLNHVPFLHEAGYGVLLFDFRAHGTSAGNICTIGFQEQLDLKAAAAVVQDHVRPEWIGILGFSMGGSTAILAAADLPDVDAVVADCPFATLTDAIYDVCRKDRLPVLGGWMGIQMCRLRFGIKVDAVDVTKALRRMGSRPVFIIQSEHDPIVSRQQTERILASLDQSGAYWFVPNAQHVRGFEEQPEEYKRRVLDFFANSVSEIES